MAIRIDIDLSALELSERVSRSTFSALELSERVSRSTLIAQACLSQKRIYHSKPK